MGKPADKFLPVCPEFIPCLRGEFETFLFIIVEHVRQFFRGALVYDDRIFLKIKVEASRIKVGTAYGAEKSVNHYDFRVVESRFVNVYIGTMFHEFVHVVENAVRSQWYVAVCRYHYLNFHTALYRIA